MLTWMRRLLVAHTIALYVSDTEVVGNTDGQSKGLSKLPIGPLVGYNAV